MKMEHFGAVFKLDLNKDAIARGGGNCLLLPHTGYAYVFNHLNNLNKKLN